MYPVPDCEVPNIKGNSKVGGRQGMAGQAGSQWFQHCFYKLCGECPLPCTMWGGSGLLLLHPADLTSNRYLGMASTEAQNGEERQTLDRSTLTLAVT